MAADEDAPDDETDRQLRWRRFGTVLLGTLLTAALSGLVYFANRAETEQDDALARQRNSFEVIELARTLDGAIFSAEAQLARYVVSLDPQVGRRYQEKWRDAGRLIERLTRETRDSALQQANMRIVRATYAERGSVLNDIALRTTYDQRLGALARFHMAAKAESVDRINRALDIVIEDEHRQLKERNRLVDRTQMQTALLNRSTSVIGLVMLVAALVALWVARGAARERRYIRRLAQAEARRVDTLEAAVAARTRELVAAHGALRQEMADRERAEKNLRQLQKMEAMGKLAGGIAHDFNNMLAVVVGGLELARRALDRAPGQAARHIDHALEGADRAATLTRRLLNFARAEPARNEPLGPDILMADMRDLIDRTIGDQIAVELDLAAGDWTLWTDRGQLESALVNLCVNARDAMDGKGHLTISTRQVRLRANEIGKCAAGEYIRLAVADTGHGMSPQVLERVFEPFFTTKPIGKGTGLGLWQVFSFVQRAGGVIHIETAPGQGTQAQLFLPRNLQSKPALPRPSPPIAPEGDPAQRRLTILVVEDDPRVLRATVNALETLGHETLCCDHPGQTAAMLDASPQIGLILSDVLMPGLSGPEMIAALPERHSGKPVLFVTGFAGEGEHAGQLEGHIVLHKPFTLAQLERAIALATRLAEAPAPRPALRAAS